MNIVALVILIASFPFISSHVKKTSLETLKLLHVVFRHGNRTPVIREEIFNKTFNVPYPDGQLTENGKQSSFLLGRWLQNRYGPFLSSYSTNLSENVHTDSDRTQATLDYVLQGLFLSKNLTKESNLRKEFLVKRLPHNSSLLVVPTNECPIFSKLYNDYIESDEYQTMLKKYTIFDKLLEENINHTFATIRGFYFLYDIFSVEKEIGLSLPQWSEYLLSRLNDSMFDYFSSLTGTKKLQKILAGGFIKNVIESAKLKFKNQLEPKERKLFMYSGHDVNLHFVLKLFKYFNKTPYNYNACVIIEAHTIDNVHGFKVFYKNGLSNEVTAVPIPGCTSFCPLSQFYDLYKDYYVTSDTC